LYRPALKKEIIWLLRLFKLDIVEAPQHSVTVVAPFQSTAIVIAKNGQ
jgi:hypothetical protein